MTKLIKKEEKPKTPRELLFEKILAKFVTISVDGQYYAGLKHTKENPAPISNLFHFIEDELAKINT